MKQAALTAFDCKVGGSQSMLKIQSLLGISIRTSDPVIEEVSESDFMTCILSLTS